MNFNDIRTPLGFSVSCSDEYWKFICTIKHPVMKGKEDYVIQAIRNPNEIRRSKRDETVFLCYGKYRKYHVAAVVKKLNGRGFLITAYLTDKIKEGERIWKR